MTRKTRGSAWTAKALLTLALALLCAPTAGAETKFLEIRVNVEEEPSLPSEARLTVRLLDLSPREGEALEITAVTVAPGRAYPIPVTLVYDDALTSGRGPFVLTGEIRQGERLMYRTPRGRRVLEDDIPGQSPEIALVPARPLTGETSPVGRTYALVKIGETEARSFTRGRLTLTESGIASGSTGCNRFTAPYEIAGDTLSFGRVKRGLRGCSSTLREQERSFYSAIFRTRAFGIDEGNLILLNNAGLELMEFEPFD